VERANFLEPPPLGVTVRDGGCDFDSIPPEEQPAARGGRPDVGREKARRFIRDALTQRNDQIGNELAAECGKATKVSDSTFWRAVDDMRENGELVTRGGKGTGRQTVLSLSPPGGP
jgi:hypothetical protein